MVKFLVKSRLGATITRLPNSWYGFIEIGPYMADMGVSLDKHGVANGWAKWPFSFDPVWVNSCDKFEFSENYSPDYLEETLAGYQRFLT